MVDLHNDAAYVRGRLEKLDKGKGALKSPKAAKKKMLATNVKENKKYGNRQSASGRSSNTEIDNGSSTKSKRPAGPYKRSYCVFCENVGHATFYCRKKEYSFEYKLAQVKKHKVCICCLRSGDHKLADCEYKKVCPICKKTHNMNLHQSSDIFAFLEQQKDGKPQGDGDQTAADKRRHSVGSQESISPKD